MLWQLQNSGVACSYSSCSLPLSLSEVWQVWMKTTAHSVSLFVDTLPHFEAQIMKLLNGPVVCLHHSIDQKMNLSFLTNFNCSFSRLYFGHRCWYKGLLDIRCDKKFNENIFILILSMSSVLSVIVHLCFCLYVMTFVLFHPHGCIETSLDQQLLVSEQKGKIRRTKKRQWHEKMKSWSKYQTSTRTCYCFYFTYFLFISFGIWMHGIYVTWHM